MTLELETVDRVVLEMAGELVDSFLNPSPGTGRPSRNQQAIFHKYLHTYARTREITTIKAKEELRISLNRLRDEMIL